MPFSTIITIFGDDGDYDCGVGGDLKFDHGSDWVLMVAMVMVASLKVFVVVFICNGIIWN